MNVTTLNDDKSLEIFIQHPTMSDLEEIIAIECSVFEEGVADTIEVMRQRIERSNSTFLVAKNREGNVLGYAATTGLNQRYVTDNLFEDVPWNVELPECLLVCGLAVNPTYQGLGIANQLLCALEKCATEVGAIAISLTCLSHVVAFYEKNGYVNEGEAASQHGGKIWYNMIKELQIANKNK